MDQQQNVGFAAIQTDLEFVAEEQVVWPAYCVDTWKEDGIIGVGVHYGGITHASVNTFSNMCRL